MSDRPRVPGAAAKGLAAQARAVRAHKQKVIVASRLYRDGPVVTRVLIDGLYYDVRPYDLTLLQSGEFTPAELELHPVDEGA